MGKYDQFLAGLPAATTGQTPAQPRAAGKYDKFLAGLPPPEAQATEQPNTGPSAFQRFGKALPIAGSVVGGMLGAGAGAVTGPGAIATSAGGAALGGAAGEAARQLLGRSLGEDSPLTSTDAAKQIGVEGATSAFGQAAGVGIGKAAGEAYKAFPKIAHAFSGTPATNIARAQQRGFKVFTPGISREAAGKAQGQVEGKLVEKLFSPEERVLLKSKDAGFANSLQKSVMLKREKGLPISAKEAVGLRIMAPVVRAADTARGLSKNIELDKATAGARGVIAEKFPELAQRLADTEKAITASQLRMPLIVNKTNPNQPSKLFSGLGAVLGFLNPKLLLGNIAASPLSMGLAGATMGQVKRSIPKGARRAIQRGGSQALVRALGE